MSFKLEQGKISKVIKEIVIMKNQPNKEPKRFSTLKEPIEPN